MMQCFIDLCYLTAQRSTEIRNLRWTADPRDPDGCSWVDRAAGVIHFRPSKTEDSSGVSVDFKITPRSTRCSSVRAGSAASGRARDPHEAGEALCGKHRPEGMEGCEGGAGLEDVRYD